MTPSRTESSVPAPSTSCNRRTGRLAAAARPVLESLEGRRLLHGLIDVAVDFRPAGLAAAEDATSSNLVVDAGRPYSLQQPSGARFGWTRFGQAWRNSWTSATGDAATAADATARAQSTAASIGHHSQLAWEMSLRDGTYDVTILAGQLVASGTEHSARLAVEGNVALEHRPTPSQPFVEQTIRVTVTDGRLTLTAPDGMAATEILYLHIREVDHHSNDDNGGGSQTPFGDAPVSLPATIEAEHFDHGGQHVAFYDDDPEVNIGGSFRDDGPDILTRNGATLVGWTVSGEWLEYTIDVPTSGDYDLTLRAATGRSGSTVRLSLDGSPLASTPLAEGGWESFSTYNLGTVTIGAGEHGLRLSFENEFGGDVADVDWIRFTTATDDQPDGDDDGGDNGGDDGGTGGDYEPGTLTLGDIVERAEMARPHHEGVVETIGSKLYVFGGFDSSVTWNATTYGEVYDVNTGQWSRAADLPVAMTHVPHVVHDGKIWLFGGHTSGGGTSQHVDDIYVYDPATDQWSAVGKLKYVTSSGGAAVVGSRVHVFGGYYVDNNGEFLSHSFHHVSLDLNDIAAGWREEPDVPVGRDHPASAVIDGKIYLIGGQFEDGQYDQVQKDMWRYDPASKTWEKMADMPAERAHIAPSTKVYRGRIIVVGGNHNGPMIDNMADEIFMYDPSNNSWSILGHLPEHRRSAHVGIIGDSLFIAGGGVYAPQQQLWEAELEFVPA